MSFFASLFKRGKKDSKTATDLKQDLKLPNKKGNFIGDKYEVYGELGHGGFGIVYKVHWDATREVYALKTFRDEYLEDQTTRELFRREANVWIELERHPYIVRAYFVDEVAGRFYIVLEYIAPNEQGLNSLEGYLLHNPPNFAQSLRWAVQFCYGMEYANSKDVRCHRDIKPSNIMIGADKTIKISDFGLAGVLGMAKTAGIKLNIQHGRVGLSGSIMEGKGCGTPTHMPPEQFIDAANCDQRSDMYAFGVVLYQMATSGKLPFLASLPRNDSIEEQVRFGREMYLLQSKASVPKINSPLFPIIQRCLEKEPSRRYQTFRELRADLEPLLERQTGEKVEPPELKGLEAWEWTTKGYSLNSLGRFDEAIKCCNKALDIDPQEAGAWNNKGISLNCLGHFGEAMKCFDKALEINPRQAEAWNNKGYSYYSLGHFVEAIKCYDKALEINPQYADAWNSKGNSLSRLSRFAEAIRCLDKTLEINSQQPSALAVKGYILNCLCRFDEAIRCCNKALEIDPRQSNAWYNKALAEEKLGRWSDAIHSFQKFIEVAPANYANYINTARQRIHQLESR